MLLAGIFDQSMVAGSAANAEPAANALMLRIKAVLFMHYSCLVYGFSDAAILFCDSPPGLILVKPGRAAVADTGRQFRNRGAPSPGATRMETVKADVAIIGAG